MKTHIEQATAVLLKLKEKALVDSKKAKDSGFEILAAGLESASHAYSVAIGVLSDCAKQL